MSLFLEVAIILLFVSTKTPHFVDRGVILLFVSTQTPVFVDRMSFMRSVFDGLQVCTTKSRGFRRTKTPNASLSRFTLKITSVSEGDPMLFFEQV
jgi:hypothetical protein